MSKPFVGAEVDAIRALALAYPETVEEFPWGHSAIKVRSKAFVFIGGEAGTVSLSCKLPSSHGAALLLPFASPTGYGLGKSGWVSARFPSGAPLPLALLAEWIDESYRAVAPKKLAALVAKAGAAEPARGDKSEAVKKVAAKTAAAKKPAAKRTAAKKTAAKAAAKKTAAKRIAKKPAAKKAAKAAVRRRGAD